MLREPYSFSSVNEAQTVRAVFDDYFETSKCQINWTNTLCEPSRKQTTQTIINKKKVNRSAERNSSLMKNAHLWLNYEHDRRKSKIDARIEEFFFYEKDWDGDGAKEIPSSAIYQSLTFLKEFRSHFVGKEPRSAAASPDGEIVLYWCSLAGYVEINFSGNGKLLMYCDFGSDEMRLIEEDFQAIENFDTSRIWQALSNFLEQDDWEQENGM